MIFLNLRIHKNHESDEHTTNKSSPLSVKNPKQLTDFSLLVCLLNLVVVFSILS